MDSNSLVTRSGYHFMFDKDNVDGFFVEFNSLVTPTEAKAERFFLAIHAAYDSNSYFVNNLKIYVDYIDPVKGDRILQDISEAVSRHYSSLLLQIYPTVESFIGPDPESPLLAKMVRLVRFYEEDVPEGQLVDRAKQILSTIYGGIPRNGDDDQLGYGNRISELDETHWFSLIHCDVPIMPVDLVQLRDKAGQPILPDLTGLYHPVGLTFSSGPIEMNRTLRYSDPLLTRGSFSFDFSIVIENPLTDDLQSIRKAIKENAEAIQQICDHINGDMWPKIDELEEKWNKVSPAISKIDLRITDVENALSESKSILEAIRKKLNEL